MGSKESRDDAKHVIGLIIGVGKVFHEAVVVNSSVQFALHIPIPISIVHVLLVMRDRAHYDDCEDRLG